MKRFFRRVAGFEGLVMKWQEPSWFRLRLLGDLPVRFAVCGGAWLAGIGVMLVVFAYNSHRPDPLLAVFLGGVIGFIPAFLLLMRNGSGLGGNVWVYEDKLATSRTVQKLGLGSVYGMRMQWLEWPWHTIRRVCIIPGRMLDKSFSVGLVDLGAGEEVFGVPHGVDLAKFQQHLEAKHVAVVHDRPLPPSYRSGYGRGSAVQALLLGGVVCFGGLVFHGLHTGHRLGLRDRAPSLADLPAPPPISDDDSPAVRRTAQQKHAQRSKPRPEPEPPPMPPVVGAPPSHGPRRDLRGGFPGAPRTPEPPSIPGLRGVPTNALPPGATIGTPPVTKAAPPPANLKTYDTPAVGGAGGGQYRSVSAAGEAMAGFRWMPGSWNGKQALGTLEPIYARDSAPAAGQGAKAKDGYAVGGLEINAGEFVFAVRPVFMKLKADGSLDPSDRYPGEWLGSKGGGATKTLGGTGSRVIGIHGTRGAVVDSVGLVLGKSR